MSVSLNTFKIVKTKEINENYYNSKMIVFFTWIKNKKLKICTSVTYWWFKNPIILNLTVYLIYCKNVIYLVETKLKSWKPKISAFLKKIFFFF